MCPVDGPGLSRAWGLDDCVLDRIAAMEAERFERKAAVVANGLGKCSKAVWAFDCDTGRGRAVVAVSIDSKRYSGAGRLSSVVIFPGQGADDL